jgi:peptide/nickel transport system permease protein
MHRPELFAMPKFVMLWTDFSVWFLVLALVAYGWTVARNANLAANWVKVFRSGPALASAVVLLACLLVTLADSLHFRPALPAAAGAQPGAATVYDTRVKSLLDVGLQTAIDSREATYSRPLACVSFTKESGEVNGQVQRVAPRLKFGCAHLSRPESQRAADLTQRVVTGMLAGGLAAAVLSLLLLGWVARHAQASLAVAAGQVWRNETRTPWRVAVATLLVLGLVAGAIVSLMGHYHVFGTDVTGNDVLYQTLKSIRTAFVIGTLATLATLPVAVVLGIMAEIGRAHV